MGIWKSYGDCLWMNAEVKNAAEQGMRGLSMKGAHVSFPHLFPRAVSSWKSPPLEKMNHR